jgi:hypothetical protein
MGGGAACSGGALSLLQWQGTRWSRLRGVKEGVLMAGALRDEGDIPLLNAGQCGVAGGGETSLWHGRDRLAWGTKLTGGACLAVT